MFSKYYINKPVRNNVVLWVVVFIFFDICPSLEITKSLNINKYSSSICRLFFATTVKNRYIIVFRFKCSSSVTSEKEDSHKLTAFGVLLPYLSLSLSH